MGRAFEYRKARKLKRWGNMARTFTKLGKEIEIAVKAGGPDPGGNVRLRVDSECQGSQHALKRMSKGLLNVPFQKIQLTTKRWYMKVMVRMALP